MRDLKRAIHFDFHSMPDYPDLFDDFSGEDFAKTLSDANVTYINFFARCNVGFSYYPTKTGIMHPYLKNRDILGDVIRECHKKDIGVTAYFNAGLCQEVANIHRDWTVMRKDGRIIDENPEGPVYRRMCYNTGYGEHLKNEIKEVLALYPEVDGIFVDCFIMPQPCYGAECTDLMKREGVDIDDDNAVLMFHKRKRMEYALELRKLVPSDKYFYVNGLSGILDNDSDFDNRIKYNSHAEIESLPTGGWGYDYFPASCAYNRNLFDKRLFMTGRFHQSWGDFGGIRSKPALECDAYTALANCAQISIGDHLHPRGVPEKALMSIIKDIFGDVKKVEKWTDGTENISEIGVFNALPYDNGNGDSYMQRGIVFEGVARIMGELKYQFDIVDDSMELDPYRLLILPDVMTLGDAVKTKISEYIKKGGKIISTGISGLNTGLSDFALPEWNFTYDGEGKYSVSYFKPLKPVDKGLPDMLLSMYENGISLFPKEGNEILARLWRPYFNKHWDGKHSFDTYMPYDSETHEAVVLREENVLHISFPLFTAYRLTAYPVYKTLIKNCIELLYQDKLIEMDVPSFVRAGLTKKDNYRILHILSYCPERKGRNVAMIEEGIKLYNTKARIKGSNIKKIYSIPNMDNVEFSVAGGYTEFIIPEIDGHGMFVLEG